MGLVNFAIDLAAVLSASRSVASKHVALRARQVEYYGKTSSIAAAFRGQQHGNRNGAGDAADKPESSGVNVASATPRGSSEVIKASRNALEAAVAAPSRDVVNSTVDDAGKGTVITASPDGTPHGNDVSTLLSQDSERRLKAHQPEATTTGFSVPPVEPPSPPSTLHGLKSQGDTGEKEKAQAVPSLDNQKDADGEPVPEGLILDGLFRTNRARLNPLWKGTKPGQRPKKPVPGAVDFGHGSSNKQESSILQELSKKPESFSKFTPGNKEKSNLKELPKTTQIVDDLKPSEPTAEALEARRTDEAASLADSQIQTGNTGATQAPEPTPSRPVSHQIEQTEKQVSKEEASAMGEILGGAATTPTYELRESSVPSSRLGRIWNYSGLAAGIFAGAVSESFSRVTGGGGEGSLMLSPANMERLVSKLSKMRGAALKLGQMMSFQDSKMLPAPIQEVLQRVQDRADYMPSWQRDRVLATNLGTEWRDLFEDFEEKPIAAASIGQVHRATLKSNGAKVAVKIQFPGVADSINSDLDNLGVLLAATKLLPKGLYLNKTIDNARTELGWECDYEREAKCAQRYGDLLATEQDVFLVPKIYPEASGKQVLTMEFMDGVGVTRIKSFTQEQRDWIGTQILRLCLREITEFRFMQTDPNWTNFLYNAERDRLVLLDFGASREYPDHFINQYVQLLAAASRSDRDAVRDMSEKLGYLTGHESKAMLDAHIASVVTLAEPFLASAPEVYDFRDQTITERVKEQIPVMIKERLAPPPEETYSLHRKLSGAFLLCARMGSRVRCRELFDDAVKKSGMLEKQV
ncbi:hypothetical protein VP1G_05212 [Cytospora mali]|uniref:ABC1 atypical kinase-like domain-containing protein n=1 Tax=Cytospora mali TaxID=578113 RepID=A0A194V264_CYTMA|nr:hypothetical protein VP1G_05212 [Valsa mali var. pyri (nom. inval.)]